MLYCRALCCAHGAILVSLIFLSISLKNGSIYIHWVEWIRIHLLNKVKTSTIDFHFFINQLQNAYLSLSMCWLPSKVRMYVSVQFSRSVMSDSLRPHESQHSRPPCPSPTPVTNLTCIENFNSHFAPGKFLKLLLLWCPYVYGLWPTFCVRLTRHMSRDG